MLDVHPPHRKIDGVKEFLLHILTITVGLFIALSLEGLVESVHHRHLVHQAEAAMRREVADNARDLSRIRTQIDKELKMLDDDRAVLAKIANASAEGQHLSFNMEMGALKDAAWRTAQTSGAFTYMAYEDAQDFSTVYAMQDQFRGAQEQVIKDVMDAAATVESVPDAGQWTPERMATAIDRLAVAKMRLTYLQMLVVAMDRTYRALDKE
ncbi:hypothetical protein L2Y94_12605 [Luteibacter aegosomatis]|uniref:hypothetical protein n=1 Tax=Luteibacter aegosomatis TaxID=2911537 RepID=UPI001FF91BEB|nr:hypothetical protein [Luteibacter aegosomatis]UPG84192.1 hypothetical protein L2Y94_12605 [Luteibacter aegosomatis]